MRREVDSRDDRIEELLGKVAQFEILIENQDRDHERKVREVSDKNAHLQKELDFLGHEQNTKELQLSDLRSKLAKRNEELDSLKQGLNSQI